MNSKTIITITAIIAVAALEALAIIKGIDGAVFGLVIAAISGLGGYHLGDGRVQKLLNDIKKVQ